MSDFKPGGDALMRVAVCCAPDDDGVCCVVIGVDHRLVYAYDLSPVPELPYVDPDLVPDMVVMSEDRADTRRWHYVPDGDGDDDSTPFVIGGRRRERAALPERIRVVFDPREVTS